MIAVKCLMELRLKSLDSQTRHSSWKLMMDVIKVTLTIVMRYITIETRYINDDLIINVKVT